MKRSELPLAPATVFSFNELSEVASRICPFKPAREFSFTAILAAGVQRADQKAKFLRVTARLVPGSQQVEIIPASRY